MADHSTVIFWVTLAWLLVTFHGIMLTRKRYRSGIKDRRWLAAKDINGPRTIMADGGIRAATARLCLFAAFFLIGINTLIGETAPALPARELVSTILLVLVLISQVVAAELDERDSERLMTTLQIANALKEAHQQTEPDPFHIPERT